MKKFIMMLEKHSKAIGKINKVLEMNSDGTESTRDEILLRLIRKNYTAKTIKAYVMAMKLMKNL